ncbi:NAD-P-binding protein [Irpex rosettiformis]|uniref:NAD-P-binding protein n=1 Tax=Irpex rosettiformis TaxID=378272 RepID=A0ACB8U7A4_9APHY|nr:NAD-P-binding protein [Irpex rosettiformis]
MSKTPILLLGPTGYLGSTVLSRLLAHPKKDTFEVTVLIRSEDKARKLETFGVKPVIGSIKDTALVEKLAEQAHVIFNIADSDDMGATKGFLAGSKKRHKKTGDVPVIIHTSGTGIFMFAGANNGLSITDRIFSDDDAEDIDKSTPDSALHRNVDLVVLKADEEGYAKTYLVLPSTIWGVASNPIIDAGIANKFSIQVPAMIRAAIGRGQAGIVGKGQGLWNGINVNEQAEFYVTLYDAITTNPSAVGHGHNGYYFGENGEYTWYELAKAIGKALVKRGLSTSDEPTTFSKEELIKYFWTEEISGIWGSNARVKAPRARSLGWQPKLTIEDFLASIDAEVEAHLKHQKA